MVKFDLRISGAVVAVFEAYPRHFDFEYEVCVLQKSGVRGGKRLCRREVFVSDELISRETKTDFDLLGSISLYVDDKWFADFTVGNTRIKVILDEESNRVMLEADGVEVKYWDL